MGFIGVQPASAPLTSSDIADDVVNSDHLGDTTISGFDALTTAPADTDEFLISDGGVLKRIDASFVGGGVDGVTSSSSSTAISIDSTGAVTKPLQPAYGGYKNSTTSNATGDGTELILGDSSHAMSEIYDNNADFNTSTGTFTCPVTGRYLMSLNLFAGDVTNSITDILIKLEASNRTVYWRREPKETAGTSNNTIGYSINAILDADTNDTLKFKIVMSGTSKTVDIIDLTQMSIELLG